MENPPTELNELPNELPNQESEKPKKPPLLFIIIAVILLVVLGGGFFALKGTSSKKPVVTPSPTPFLPPADPNIKVSLEAVASGKEVILTITDFPEDVTSVEYELTYVTGNGLPRGVLGTIRVEGSTAKLERQITLGTCSSGKCVYDENVKKITVTLKFNATTGASRFQKEYSFE